ncbi:hypothetical protein GQ53DRAFT_878691, partial [Thozetella sp. PMI_491]
LFSPRVSTILGLVGRIREENTGDKIIIISKWRKFLDIVCHAIARRFSDLKCAEYNGTIPREHAGARATIQADFNQKDSGTSVLLLTDGIGGAGLNLQGANHIIIAAPGWTPGGENQIIGRSHRMGQENTVHVYKIIAAESRIDIHMRNSQGQKARPRTIITTDGPATILIVARLPGLYYRSRA